MSGSQSVQISAAEYAEMKKLNGLFDKVWNDPGIGLQVQQATKKYEPNVVLPEDHPIARQAQQGIAAVTEQVAGLTAMFTEFTTKAKQKEDEAQLRGTLGNVQDKYRLTDAGMAEVIKTMQDRQLADPEAAAALYVQNQPKTPPVSATARLFDNKADMFGTTRQDAAWEKLHTDMDGFFADTVAEVFNEMPA